MRQKHSAHQKGKQSIKTKQRSQSCLLGMWTFSQSLKQTNHITNFFGSECTVPNPFFLLKLLVRNSFDDSDDYKGFLEWIIGGVIANIPASCSGNIQCHTRLIQNTTRYYASYPRSWKKTQTNSTGLATISLHLLSEFFRLY
jgi:hypothetical protein